jgi:hypothetical protein
MMKVSVAEQFWLFVTVTQKIPVEFALNVGKELISCQRYELNIPGFNVIELPAHKFLLGPRLGKGFSFTDKVVVTIESHPKLVDKVSL